MVKQRQLTLALSTDPYFPPNRDFRLEATLRRLLRLIAGGRAKTRAMLEKAFELQRACSEDPSREYLIRRMQEIKLEEVTLYPPRDDLMKNCLLAVQKEPDKYYKRGETSHPLTQQIPPSPVQ